MTRKTTTIEKEWLEQKYLIEKLSILQISKKYNLTFNNVRYYLKKYNIPRRSKCLKGDINEITNNKLSKTKLQEYINSNYSLLEISKLTKSSSKTIHKLMVLYKINRKMNPKINLINQKFGRGIVLKESHIKNGQQFWSLKCECGNLYQTTTTSLRTGNCKSCGCLQKETARATRWKGYKNVPHAYFSDTKRRANKEGHDFRITIEDMGDLFELQNEKCALCSEKLYFRYSKHKGTASLDRIDSSKGYIKENIQWVHKEIQKMKSDLGQDNFVKRCKMVAKNAK